MEPTPQRKIIHVDMDAFFASVEQLDRPELRGKPVAVGGNKERGVVAAASYEARKFGVKSAMPSAIAARQCPSLIFVAPRFDRYQELSHKIRDIFFEYTDLVEPLSLDEAYLDVTHNKTGVNSATRIAQQIKDRIKTQVGLTASAGISFNKFLAKTASDVKKPDGLFVILPEEADNYLRKMPIHRFFGIGQATAEKMKKAGIFTGEDLRKKSLEDLKLRFGKAGTYYYHICRGIDHREVTPDRERKSVSAERTFDHHIMKLEEAKEQLVRISQMTYDRYRKHETIGKTLTIKIKYGDFKQVSRSVTHEQPIRELSELTELVLSLADASIIQPEGIRLLGVGITNFQKPQEVRGVQQLTLRF